MSRMDWLRVILLAIIINNTKGEVSLRCGEDIVVQRGEKRVLRFWSAEDQLLNVDVLQKNGTEEASGLTTEGPSVGTTSEPSVVYGEDNKLRTNLNVDEEETPANELYYAHTAILTSRPNTGLSDETDNKKVSSSQNDEGDVALPTTQLPALINSISTTVSVHETTNAIRTPSNTNKINDESPSTDDSTQRLPINVVTQAPELHKPENFVINSAHEAENSVNPYIASADHEESTDSKPVIFPVKPDTNENNEVYVHIAGGHINEDNPYLGSDSDSTSTKQQQPEHEQKHAQSLKPHTTLEDGDQKHHQKHHSEVGSVETKSSNEDDPTTTESSEIATEAFTESAEDITYKPELVSELYTDIFTEVYTEIQTEVYTEIYPIVVDEEANETLISLTEHSSGTENPSNLYSSSGEDRNPVVTSANQERQEDIEIYEEETESTTLQPGLQHNIQQQAPGLQQNVNIKQQNLQNQQTSESGQKTHQQIHHSHPNIQLESTITKLTENEGSLFSSTGDTTINPSEDSEHESTTKFNLSILDDVDEAETQTENFSSIVNLYTGSPDNEDGGVELSTEETTERPFSFNIPELKLAEDAESTSGNEGNSNIYDSSTSGYDNPSNDYTEINPYTDSIDYDDRKVENSSQETTERFFSFNIPVVKLEEKDKTRTESVYENTEEGIYETSTNGNIDIKEDSTQILGINIQKPSLHQTDIKLGDPLSSGNILMRIDGLDDGSNALRNEFVGATEEEYKEITTDNIMSGVTDGTDSYHEFTTTSADLVYKSTEYTNKEESTIGSLKDSMQDDKSTQMPNFSSTKMQTDGEATEPSISNANFGTNVKEIQKINAFINNQPVYEIIKTEPIETDIYNQENPEDPVTKVESGGDVNSFTTGPSIFASGNEDVNDEDTETPNDSNTEATLPTRSDNSNDSVYEDGSYTENSLGTNDSIKGTSDENTKIITKDDSEIKENNIKLTNVTESNAEVQPLGVTKSTTKFPPNNYEDGTNIRTTTEEPDIFASIIDRWTEALEKLPDELHVDDLVIDVSDFIDIKSDSLESDINTQNIEPADLPKEHRDSQSTKTEATNAPTETGSTDKFHGPDSLAMAGFMDNSHTLEPNDFDYTTQDPLLIYSEPSTETVTDPSTQTMTQSTPEKTTEIIYEYPSLTEEDDFKGYEYYEDLVDSLDVKERPYSKVPTEGTTSDMMLTEDFTDSTTQAIQSIRTPDLIYPEPEMDSNGLSTLPPVGEYFTENTDSLTQTFSTTSLERSEMDETNADNNDDYDSNADANYTTEYPNVATNANDNPDTEKSSQGTVTTTAFSIPLLALRDQSMLNNLLNGQAPTGGSNVIIKEQGSKVAISAPVNNVIYLPQDFQQSSTTEQSVTETTGVENQKHDQDKTTIAQTPVFEVPDTTQIASTQYHGDYTTVWEDDIPSSTPETNSITVNSILSQDTDTETTTTELRSEDDVSYSNDSLFQSANNDSALKERSDVELNIKESITNSEADESYTTEQITVRSFTVPSTTEIELEESTESFWNMVRQKIRFDISTTAPLTTTFTNLNSPMTPEKTAEGVVKSSGDTVHLEQNESPLAAEPLSTNKDPETKGKPATTETLDDESILNDDYNKTTTIRTVTGRTSDNSELATILIPSAIVSGLHTTKEPTHYPQNEKLAEGNETNQQDVVYSPQAPGGISRKDDEGQTDYGGDSPFFIRLPGSPNAIPVYIQYEPVEIKYVPTEGLDVDIGNDNDSNEKIADELKNQYIIRDGIGFTSTYDTDTYENETESVNNINVKLGNVASNESTTAQYSETDATTTFGNMGNFTQFQREVVETDPGSNTLLDGIYRIIDNMAAAVNNHYSEPSESNKDSESDFFKPNKPFEKRPDPFFVMEAPKLGNEDDYKQESSYHETNDNTHSTIKVHQNDNGYSLDVSSKFEIDGSLDRIGKPGIVEDVPVGDDTNKGVLYPGDYYLHDSYVGVNLTSLVNPVFNYRPRSTTPPSIDDLMSPQYTPFPITANPPRSKTSESSIAALQQVTDSSLNSVYEDDFGEGKENDTEFFSATQQTAGSVTTTELPTTTTTSPKALPSIEYSPIPAVDFANSYDPSYIPDSLFENEESIVAPYYNPFTGFPGSFNDQVPQDAERESEIEFNVTEMVSATTEQEHTPSTIDQQDKPNKVLLPTEQFMAHQQVWAFPQSREDPGHLDYDSYKPYPEVPGRVYSAFYSPLDVPGIDPAIFSYRKVPPPEVPENGDPVVNRYDTLIDYDTHKSNYHMGEAEKEALTAAAAATAAEEQKWEDSASYLLPNITREVNDDGSDPSQHVLLRPQFFDYLNSLPYALLRKFLDPTTPAEGERLKRSAPRQGEQIFCEWNIRTQPGLYLLMTFHNLSAAYTVDCHGAYIEVERENNGYDARWCGNRVGQAGTRPHVIFAKTEVRITVYDDGSGDKSLPTGFEADIEVIDLFDSKDYNNFMRSNAYPHIRRLLLG